MLTCLILLRKILMSYQYMHLMQRNNIETASNFVRRNRVSARLKEQIIAYMCLRYKAENLNHHQLMEQLPKSIRKTICQYLFLPAAEKKFIILEASQETSCCPGCVCVYIYLKETCA